MSAVIREGLIYQDIRMDKDALYTLLLTTGYLTAVWRQDIPNGMLCQLKIPNEEVRHVFQSEILDRFCADGDVSRFGIPPAGDTSGMEVRYRLLREKNPCISRANVLNYSSIGFE